MPSFKLSFSLRTTGQVKQVHLIGSWDGYTGQLPLARDGTSSKGLKWKGTFRFSSSLLQPGQRYWFYYMLDGYAVSHDPSKEFTVEPTTGRKLNILDVPKSSGSSSSSSSSSTKSRRSSREIPRGRPATAIESPKPVRPGHLAKRLEEAALQQLTASMAQTNIEDDYSSSEDDEDDDSEINSDADSDCPSLASSSLVSGSSGRSTPSSVTSSCSCERYGITRKGDRVKLDCRGARCGYEDDESSCDEDEQAEYRVRVKA